MKAILQENSIVFEKTHDLDVLLDKCNMIVPELSNFKRELVELSSFAVEVRYPGIEATLEEAETFLKLAENIRIIIRKYFRLEI